MEDFYELLIADVSKRCDVSKDRVRNIIDFLDRKDYLDLDVIEDHYMKDYEL